MIRIPLSTVPEARVLSSGDEPLTVSSSGRSIDAIDARLDHLELRLVAHAEEFRGEMVERVERIHCQLENAMKPFKPDDETGEVVHNVVEFRAEESDFHHLHAKNACEALSELNRTLRSSREHLEALSHSVERMKRAIGK